MIETKSLTKIFDGIVALDNVEMHVPKGAIYGLVGPNGAGKTTMIRHISGAMQPDKGEVLVDGQPVIDNSAVKARMAFLPDDLFFFPTANIIDMRNFYRQTYITFDDTRFETLKDFFFLDEKQYIRRFSRGMQKQAALWLAICCRPDVVLLDEPMDGLDPIMRHNIWSLLLQDVAERQTTIFISSHNLRELEDVCDHVGIMQNGKLILERNLAELQSDIIKLQVVFEDEPPEEMSEFDIMNVVSSGRVREYIIRGKQDEILDKVKLMRPVLVDSLSLTLEEIFVYELGGLDYAEINI